MAQHKTTEETKQMFRGPPGKVDFIARSYEEEFEAARNQPVERLGMWYDQALTRWGGES